MFKAGRDCSDYNRDMLEAIVEVEEFTKEMTFEEFYHDRKTISPWRSGETYFKRTEA